MSKVVIIGGGIIGLSSAYFLRKKGLDVVVIDKGTPGSGCSCGNMGWVCPSLSEPVPAPGLVKTTLKWMIKKDSPLYIKPAAVPSLFSWLIQFWKFCNEEAFTSGYNAGLELSKNTLKLFDELEENKQLEFESYRKGLLYVFLKENLIEERYHELEAAEKIGLPSPQLKTRKQVLEMEPNLINEVKGGVFLPAERHVRPESLNKGLYNWLVENGAAILSNSEVQEFIINEETVVGVRANHEVLAGDQFLVTTGALAGKLLKKVGYSLPITAGKGYSITISSPSIQIQQPLYLGDSKVAISPFKDAIRIGGTMELSGLNTNLDLRRIDNLRNSIKRYFKNSIIGKEKIWTGMRPITPDGLPVLGRLDPYSNLYIGSGHAMSGISMSLSTGLILSDLLSEGKSAIDLKPFSPSRFRVKTRILQKKTFEETTNHNR
ncbi:MAG TPA: FAD-dependent oxidoreductase [Bacillus sp. (in: firmicutes)]|nr:FAD-dependent oxidoreductase [Bacillus sp. (in: firmicutes)]